MEQLLEWLWPLFAIGAYTLFCALCVDLLYLVSGWLLAIPQPGQARQLTQAGILAGLLLVVVGGTAGLILKRKRRDE